MPELEHLLAEINAAENYSEIRKQWRPTQTGSIDIRIAADGQWFHEGRVFQRQSLVKLFARVLCKQGEEYFLLTPNEKLKIQVDDAPFVATLVERRQSALVFTTNLGEHIIVDHKHPLRLEIETQTQIPRPYVHCRDGLDALISRSAFFDLANLAEEHERDGKLYLTINSLDYEFEFSCSDSPENE
ncbi:MAG: DUF1285 domain-containing protein [Gammaproteobacteria bacterium]|nr:DUF1285 domain-containing protein [Gammaproteobacteria bacterium]